MSDGYTFGGKSIGEIASGSRDPYTRDFDESSFRLRTEFGVGLATAGSRSHAVVSGITDDFVGPRREPDFWLTVEDGVMRAVYAPVPGAVEAFVTRGDVNEVTIIRWGPADASAYMGDEMAYRLLYGDLRHGGPRPPWWTRHTLGDRERARDHRRHPRCEGSLHRPYPRDVPDPELS